MRHSNPFLLVHGAFHGAWCWQDLVAVLQARNRQATAIDLPGAGDDPADASTVTVDNYADRIIETAGKLGDRIILVGHSMGGISITLAAERRPDLFSALVYVSALVPSHRQSAQMVVEANEPASRGLARQLSADGLMLEPPVPEASRMAFYDDCPAALMEDALPRLRPIPISVLISPLDLPAERAKALPRHYVECTEDRALTLAAQRRIVAAQPRMTVHTLESSHSPFFTMPDRLADILIAVGQEL